MKDWTNLTWLERIYPGMPSAQKKIQKNMRKKSWVERMDDYGITHKVKSPDGSTAYTRHSYVPMKGDTVDEGVRDHSLMAYMSGLKEIKQWDSSIPCHKLFTTEEKSAGVYYPLLNSASAIQARETTRRIFPNG